VKEKLEDDISLSCLGNFLAGMALEHDLLTSQKDNDIPGGCTAVTVATVENISAQLNNVDRSRIVS
jgi:hypothetical protein